MNERIAICPGSFDPVTRGHEDIIRRGLAFSDRVIVAVAHAPQQPRQGMFSIDERVRLIGEAFADEPRVEAAEFTGLLVDFARKRGAKIVIRGVRSVKDFEYEQQMAMMNRSLLADLETVFMAPDPAHAFVSATLVRQIARLGGHVAPFLSPAVLHHVLEKVAGRKSAASA
jgi:pantetheine-phosphate adenylyltransferase